MNRSFTRTAWLAAALAAVSLFSCRREENPQKEQVPDGPVSIDVTIDQETRTSVSETTGAITFTEGDGIKIFNGAGVYKGITQSTESSGMFVMEDGFSAGSGYAGFPADFVTDITSAGVTFTLPATYRYSQVGGSSANTAKVPCPMVGTYSGGGISLKPVCALVRFYLTNVAAGTLSFTFRSPVTGTATVTTPSGTNDGILQNGLGNANATITVTGVPKVEDGDVVYITLPVPVGTVPQNVVVRNAPADGTADRRFASMTGIGQALERGHGHRFVNIFFYRHEYVDMGTVTVGGVSKNLKWATCNVGAENPWDYGDYFAWGETEPKSNYAWSNYFDTTDGGSTFIKYYIKGGKTVLDLEDDAANKNWGGTWRIPTDEEWDALHDKTLYDWVWTTDYNGSGKDGMLVTRKDGTGPCSGNSIFLPAAGERDGTSSSVVGSWGFYWSSTLNTVSSDNALYKSFRSSGVYYGSSYRRCGQPVRPLTE